MTITWAVLTVTVAAALLLPATGDQQLTTANEPPYKCFKGFFVPDGPSNITDPCSTYGSCIRAVYEETTPDRKSIRIHMMCYPTKCYGSRKESVSELSDLSGRVRSTTTTVTLICCCTGNFCNSEKCYGRLVGVEITPETMSSFILPILGCGFITISLASLGFIATKRRQKQQFVMRRRMHNSVNE